MRVHAFFGWTSLHAMAAQMSPRAPLTNLISLLNQCIHFSLDCLMRLQLSCHTQVIPNVSATHGVCWGCWGCCCLQPVSRFDAQLAKARAGRTLTCMCPFMLLHHRRGLRTLDLRLHAVQCGGYVQPAVASLCPSAENTY